MILVIENVHQIGIKRMDILEEKQSSVLAQESHLNVSVILEVTCLPCHAPFIPPTAPANSPLVHAPPPPLLKTRIHACRHVVIAPRPPKCKGLLAPLAPDPLLSWQASQERLFSFLNPIVPGACPPVISSDPPQTPFFLPEFCRQPATQAS